MIDCLNITNAHIFGDAMASQHRLRHRAFIDRQDYQVPSWQGMEYDQFDTPAAHYMVWRDQFGEVRAVARVSPTSKPYMLENVWPEKVTAMALPHSSAVWEGTRFSVDRDLSPRLRQRIVCEIVVGFTEFAQLNGIDAFIGVMPMGIYRSVFERNGWPVDYIGSPWTQDGIRICAAQLHVNDQITEAVRAKTNIRNSVLNSTLPVSAPVSAPTSVPAPVHAQPPATVHIQAA